MILDRRRRQQDQRHQGSPRHHRPGPDRSQDAGRVGSQGRQGRRQQGRSRRDQEEARGSRRDRRAQVSFFRLTGTRKGGGPAGAALFLCSPFAKRQAARAMPSFVEQVLCPAPRQANLPAGIRAPRTVRRAWKSGSPRALPVFEHGKIGERNAHLIGQLGQRHAALVEQIVELDGHAPSHRPLDLVAHGRSLREQPGEHEQQQCQQDIG